MFCDLVGSTPLSARLDPEDMREVIATFYRHVAETVRPHGGFVAQYYGDGVLVYFGYPQAQERDAEGAVRAGLELIAAIAALSVPVPLQTRIGIATGLVVAGDLFEAGQAQRHGIVGETPNLAARLQALADPNTVVIDERTRRLIGELFEMHELGGKNLKGIAGAVPVWAVLRPSLIESRFEALHASGVTALVGREEECELLLRRWSKAASGEGQAVLISGEGGIGKSRLTTEILQRLDGEPRQRLRYFCSPQHTDSALYPIVNQIERNAGLAHGDSVRERLDKLDALLLAPAATSIEDRTLLAELLSLANDGRYPALALGPQQRRQRTLDALLTRIAALARSAPLLIVFEDSHWTDPTSLELLGRLVDRIESLRALLIVTFRPEFDAPWIGRPHVTTLTLNRLAQRDIGAMIDHVIGNKALPAGIRQDIIERTDGIPLFVEEMTKAVIEAASPSAAEQAVAAVPSAASPLPASLHASLMARLDRLGPAKEVAEMAAAIGREFSHALIVAVAHQPEATLQAALDRLTASGLIVRQGMPPHASYRFKHMLMQDAAYGTLLRARREALHARIAQIYERQFPEIFETQPALLAHHLALAGDAERAIGLWLKAARTAIGNGAVAEAVAQLRRALALVGEIADQKARLRHEIELQIALGNALMSLQGYSAVDTDAAFRRARKLCLEADDSVQLVRVLWGQFTGDFAGGRERTSLAVAEELLALSERLDDAAGRLLGHASVGASLLHLGSLVEARVHFERALVAGSSQQREWAFRFGQSGRVVAHAYLTLDLLLLGFADQARRHAEQTIAEAQALSHPPSLCFAHSIVSRFYYLTGEAKRLEEHSAMVARLAEEQGLGLWQALGKIYVGWSRAARGGAAEAIDLIRAGVAEYRAVGAGLSMPLYLLSLAKTLVQVGDRDEALRLIGEARSIIAQGEEGWLAAEVHRLAGESALLPPQPDAAKAQAHFAQALAVAGEQQAKFWQLRAALGMARLRCDQGERAQARDLLAAICCEFSEGVEGADWMEAKSLLNTLA
ncbi:MAG: AAA family ATPase [Xanthobacteraceae bacterium]